MRVFVLLMAGLGWFGHTAETIDFDRGKTGLPPDGWSLANTHRGEPGRWIIHPDTTASSKPNVLAQLAAHNSRTHSALALFDHGYCLDGDLSVNLKMISGKLDQTAGVVWRYQDPNNYYALSVNAIEDKITIQKVIDGRSSAVSQDFKTRQGSSISRRIDPQEWNLVKIQFRDKRMLLFLNHRRLLEVSDSAILKAGKTGVWTKGDTVAYFDDFRIDRKKE